MDDRGRPPRSDRGRDRDRTRPSLRTGQAGFPHPALQSMIIPRRERLIAYRNQGRKKVGPTCPCLCKHPVSRMASRRPALSRTVRCALPRSSLTAIDEVGFRTVSGVFIFLRSFAPPALPGFIATMNALPATEPSLRLPGRSLHLSHVPFRSFPLQPHPHRPVPSIGSPWAVTDSPLARQASPFPSRLARCTCRIEFTFVWDQPSVSGCSPPRLAATQLPSTAHRFLPPAG